MSSIDAIAPIKQAAPLSSRCAAQRQRRKLEREEADRQHEAEQKAAHEAWLTRLPLRLLALMAMARPVGGQVRLLGEVDIENVKSGDIDKLRHLRVSISFSGGSDSSIDIDLGFDAESWQFDLQVDHVQRIIDEKATKEAKLRLARETWDGLSQAQRDALGLKARP